MRRVPLCPGGPDVAAIGFGAWGLSGAYGRADDAESIATTLHALHLGASHVDTADQYGDGHNERLVGEAIRGRREDVFLATKAGLVRGPDRSLSVCGRPEYLRTSLEGSLERLGVESVDLFYLHRVDPGVPIEESVGALAQLVREGKARFIGLCEVGGELLRRAHTVHPITAVQSEYSLWSRDAEDDVLPAVRELAIGFVAFSPLGRGFLTSTFSSPSELEPGDFRRMLPRFQGQNFEDNAQLLQPLRDLAEEAGATPAQVALAWLLEQGVVAIPGTRTRSHLEENVAALQVRLTARVLARLDVAFPPGAAAGPRYAPAMTALTGAS